MPTPVLRALSEADSLWDTTKAEPAEREPHPDAKQRQVPEHIAHESPDSYLRARPEMN
jgi:hypothetical protein